MPRRDQDMDAASALSAMGRAFVSQTKHMEEHHRDPMYEISLMLTADELSELATFLKKLRKSE